MSLAKFKSDHPFCCFCGGGTATEQRDHVPPRAMFAGKYWPEGYVFPACAKCNQGSSDLDQTLALIARLSIADQHTDSDENQKYIQGVRNNTPHAVPYLFGSSTEAKKVLRELGIKKPDGMLAVDVPIALIDADAFEDLDPLFRKLYCALYYKHCNRIVPSRMKVICVRTTNQIFGSDDPFDWMRDAFFRNEPIIERAGRSLRDQFDYLWGANEDGSFAFNFHLRHSIFGVMAGPFTPDMVAKAEPWMVLG